MKEQELTSRMSEVISEFQQFDNNTNYNYHEFSLGLARECAAIVKEYNQLVRELREIIDKDPSKLPQIAKPVKAEYEN